MPISRHMETIVESMMVMVTISMGMASDPPESVANLQVALARREHALAEKALMAAFQRLPVQRHADPRPVRHRDPAALWHESALGDHIVAIPAEQGLARLAHMLHRGR